MKLVAIVLVCFVASAYADVATGIAAYNQGDYVTARKEFTTAAVAKDPEGMHLLASLYYQGHGVEKDLERAVLFFTAAADKGYRASQANLGIMYQSGDGVTKDIEKAVAYYAAAGKQGDLQSLYNLGQIYRKGLDVRQDRTKAAEYYKVAAERGHVPSAIEYGLLHAQGQGVDLSYEEAYAWMAYAAKTGSAPAQKNLNQLKRLLNRELPKAEERARQVEELIEQHTIPTAPLAIDAVKPMVNP
ncbi:MAG: tetratricopeptide repeat protein [Verrucomicrobium sp.]|nr:tetratricopeptide repeat protein [Verrucomicrobium sp.]